MRKYFILVLGLALMFLTLAGCGDDRPPASGKDDPSQLPPVTPKGGKTNPSMLIKTLADPEGSKGEVFALSHSQDGRFLASGSNDKTIKIWDTST